MSRAPHGKHVLFLLADFPGYFIECAYRIAAALKERGVQPVFAVNSPYYHRFKKVPLETVGPVHDLSQYLAEHASDDALDDVKLDYWLVYPTYTRMRAYWGKHLNDWNQYRRAVRFYRDLFERYAFSAAWSEPPSCATLCIAYAEADSRGIPFLGYCAARVNGYFNVAVDAFMAEMIVNPNPDREIPKVGETPNYIPPAHESLAGSSTLRLFRGTGEKFWRAARSRAAPSLDSGDTFAFQLRCFARDLRRKYHYKLRLRNKVFSPVPDEQSAHTAILFPLQYRPESTASVQANLYESDIETIRNIAFSLPHRTSLYVKEHPAGVGNNRRAFFDEILSFPNVHALDIYPVLGETIDRFDLVITLSGTVGFEAIQRGIPVFLLGRAFYEDYPGVTVIGSMKQLAAEVAAFVRTPKRPNPEPMRRYFQSCFPGTFDYMKAAIVTPENIQRLVAPFLRVLDEAPPKSREDARSRSAVTATPDPGSRSSERRW